MTVNLEGFVAYNLAMNMLLLFGSGRLSGLRVKGWRLCLAALFGAIYAVVSSVSFGLFLQSWYAKLLSACIMVCIAFMPNHLRKVVRASICFFVAACLMGGLGFSLMYMLGARGYGWNIAGLVAVVGSIACVALACGVRRAKLGKMIRQVVILHKGCMYKFSALIDTGNRLYEPIGGLPVMVLDAQVVGDLPMEAHRPIAFSAMHGKGTLQTFEPDAIWIDGQEGLRMAVALYPGTLSSDCQYRALLPWPCRVENGKENSKGKWLGC